MKTKNTKAAFISMVIATIIIVILNLSNLVEYLETGYIGRTFSNVCFILSDICIVIGWISFFVEKRKQKLS